MKPRETAIVWLEDISGRDYVRQGWRGSCGSAKISPPNGWALKGDGWRSRLVGYAKVDHEEVRHYRRAHGDQFLPFFRRIFTLKSCDRGEPDCRSDGYAIDTPAEAVDPRTVSPNVKPKRPGGS